MSDAKETENGKKPLGLSKPGRLELNKTVETGQVKQNFSHGRSKMVTVEKKRKRTFVTDTSGDMSEVKAGLRGAKLTEARTEEVAEVAETPVPVETPVEADLTSVSKLTDSEREARMRALESARHGADETSKPAGRGKPQISDLGRVQEEEAPAVEEPAETDEERAVREAQESEAKRLEEERKTRAKETAREPKDESGGAEDEDEEKSARKGKPAKQETKRPSPGKSREERRRHGKLTIAEAESFEELEEHRRSLASVKRQRDRDREKQRERRSEGGKVIRDVVIPETITVQELANRMAERGGVVVKKLMEMGVMATITQSIDADTAELVVQEFGHRIKRVSESDVEDHLVIDSTDDEVASVSRAPVVTVMGHVDHGKTSLLDALRESDVANHEAGGITQHIGAYQVKTEDGNVITFIDTPGHAAFTEMRARGAKVTDIVVLCVAADDGIMPQTIEAIHHAKAAEVPIIVAVNKIDKPDANPDRVKTDLLSHDIQVEDMGGDVLCVPVSALKRQNLDKLLEAIQLQAELLDLKANPDRPAEGVVVESKMEQGRGSVATVLVQRGTLNVGDIFVAGAEWGRVRALTDAHGNKMDKAGPSEPAEVLGLNGTPLAGDEVVVVGDEAKAREVSEFRQRRDRDARASIAARGTLEQMFEKIKEGEAEMLPVIIKADVHGSLEAIVGALTKMATDEVEVQVLHSGVGGINESDVTLARASNALVFGFNVRANPQAREAAKRDGVDIRYYSIIYDLTDDVKKMLSGMLSPDVSEELLGYAEIREVFSISKVGKIAGCMITEGMVKRGAKVRLLRDDVVIHEGELSQLKRFKDDVREVKEGYECGMAFANYNDIQVGDKIECFEMKEVSREL
ncbi:MAG: translation initiation factor IF-2 [Rhodospirillales bacterium]|nr:translation initiation factor IF-2 [Rhodospirillales bacterium]MBO6787544.1 translation initiation factor IF-2 [Rhodospirillales bacterium]